MLLLVAPPVEVSGSTWLELTTRPNVSAEAGEAVDIANGGIGVRARVLARPASWLTLTFEPRFYIDFVDTDRTRAEPLEAHARFRAGPIDIEAGLTRFDWGISTLHRPTDPLNPRDWGAGFFRGEKLPELALTVSGHWDSVSLDLVFVPVHRHPQYPGGGDALGVRFGSLGALNLDLREGWLFSDLGLDTMTLAARARASFGPVDLAAVWMRGPSRLPAPVLDDLTLRELVYPVDIIGGSAEAAVGPVVLRAEAAWVSSGRAPIVVNAANPQPWTEPIPDSYVSYVVGAELTLWDLIGDADLTLTAEYAGEVREFLDAQALLRPWQSDLHFLADFRLDDLDDTRVIAAVILDLPQGDVVARLAVERHLGAGFSLRIDAVLLSEGPGGALGEGDGPLTLTRSLSDRDTLSARLSWRF
ncbi:MAG: hypothetical protein ACI9WU_003793 [Myxococcota bacterium]